MGGYVLPVGKVVLVEKDATEESKRRKQERKEERERETPVLPHAH